MYLLVDPVETEYEPNILEDIQSERMTAELRDAIEDLPEVEKRILYWHFWEDVPFEEIGPRLGISENWAYTKSRLAQDRLRKCIQTSLARQTRERLFQATRITHKIIR